MGQPQVSKALNEGHKPRRLHPRIQSLVQWVLRAPAQGSLSVHPQTIKSYRFRFALPGRYFRALALACRRSPSFRPTRRSHQGPAGFRLSSLWLTIGFASLPVLSSASVLRAPRAPSSVGQRRKTRVPVNSKDLAEFSVLPSYPPLTWIELPPQVGRDPSHRLDWPGCREFAFVFPLVAVPGCPSSCSALGFLQVRFQVSMRRGDFLTPPTPPGMSLKVIWFWLWRRGLFR